MTDANDPLATLRGRKYVANSNYGHYRVLDGNTTPCRNIIADCPTAEMAQAVATALNRALEADALLAEKDAKIRRLRAMEAFLRARLLLAHVRFNEPTDEHLEMLAEAGDDEESASGGEGGEQ